MCAVDSPLAPSYLTPIESPVLTGDIEFFEGCAMKAKRLEFFRNLLNERLDSLIREAESGVGELVSEKENLPDSIDLASYESVRDFSLKMKDRERKLIYKIREAIGRIEEGEYGECVVCGEDISEGRLLARPVTTHCIDCKTEAENQERVRGL